MTKTIKTLIADDDPDARAILRTILEELDCHVDAEVEDGLDAVNQILLIQPDIAFIDIEMPIKDGFDVLGEIRGKALNTYPIIVSGHSTIKNVKATLELGAKGFVVKPYNIDKIKQILEKYQSENSAK